MNKNEISLDEIKALVFRNAELSEMYGLKFCAHCQYFRPPNFMPQFQKGDWCSNHASINAREYVTGFDSCDQFTKRGKKAPLWMRTLNKVIK